MNISEGEAHKPEGWQPGISRSRELLPKGWGCADLPSGAILSTTGNCRGLSPCTHHPAIEPERHYFCLSAFSLPATKFKVLGGCTENSSLSKSPLYPVGCLEWEFIWDQTPIIHIPSPIFSHNKTCPKATLKARARRKPHVS